MSDEKCIPTMTRALGISDAVFISEQLTQAIRRGEDNTTIKKFLALLSSFYDKKEEPLQVNPPTVPYNDDDIESFFRDLEREEFKLIKRVRLF